MTTKDDLIAARALIDTPEKVELIAERSGECAPVMQAIYDTTQPSTDGSSTKRFTELWWAVAHGSEPPVGSLYDHWRPHADIMALFDRAIEASK